MVAMEIDQQLEDLKSSESQFQLQFVKCFFPERSFQVDTDSMRVVLLSKRLAFKSEIARSQIVKTTRHEDFVANYGRKERAEELKHPEDVLHSLQVELLLAKLNHLAGNLEYSLSQCDVESFLKLGRSFYEIELCEKMVDMLLSLLKDEIFGTNFQIGDLEVNFRFHNILKVNKTR
jgi:hypothetical protein